MLRTLALQICQCKKLRLHRAYAENLCVLCSGKSMRSLLPALSSLERPIAMLRDLNIEKPLYLCVSALKKKLQQL